VVGGIATGVIKRLSKSEHDAQRERERRLRVKAYARWHPQREETKQLNPFSPNVVEQKFSGTPIRDSA
jgi:hypothetical protein